MPTSIDFDLHFLAKKAKCRLNCKKQYSMSDGLSPLALRNKEKANSDYYKVVKMLISKETIYDPISRLIGKALSSIPDSAEKQRIVLETCNMFMLMRQRFKRNLLVALREGKHYVYKDVEVAPKEILSKLH